MCVTVVHAKLSLPKIWINQNLYLCPKFEDILYSPKTFKSTQIFISNLYLYFIFWWPLVDTPLRAKLADKKIQCS